MDVIGFFNALAESWVSIMSGIASVVLAGLGALYSYRKKVLPSRALWVAALVCFFVATIKVWTTEHRKYLVEEAKNKPQFIIDVGNLFARDLSEDKHASYLFPVLAIRNLGAESVVRGWQLTVKFKDGHIESSEPWYVPNQKQQFMTEYESNYYSITLYAEDFLPDKTLKERIGHNGMMTGWACFRIAGVTTAELTNLASETTITIGDAIGNTYTVSESLTPKGMPRYMPGMRVPETRRGDSKEVDNHK